MPLTDTFLPDRRVPTSMSVVNALGGPMSMPDRNWVGLRQPFLDSRGRACVIINDVDFNMRKGKGFTRNDSTGGEPKKTIKVYKLSDLHNMGYQLPVTNATTLRKEVWIEMTRRNVLAARQRLRLMSDLEGVVGYGGFNALSRMTLEYQAMSDPGEAMVDMDASTDGKTDTPQFLLRSLPLPITHADYGYSERELMVSRNSDAPFDMVMGEACSRRVGESLEDQGIGNTTGVTYATQTAGPGTHSGTSTVYGLTNFPQRLTKTNFTTPTTTNGPTTYAEVLAALNQLFAQFFYGPFVLYHSTDWSPYMDSPFSTAGGNHPGETLRTMLMKIPDISDVRRLDRLTSTFTLVFVQLTSEVIECVNGLDLTTIQWQEKGGLQLRFKVMAIKPLRLRSDYNTRTGILHGTTS